MESGEIFAYWRWRARSCWHFPEVHVCRQPHLKGFSLMVNSIYNGQRFEDLWLDK
jgi:hypothetical protein